MNAEIRYLEIRTWMLAMSVNFALVVSGFVTCEALDDDVVEAREACFDEVLDDHCYGCEPDACLRYRQGLFALCLGENPQPSEETQPSANPQPSEEPPSKEPSL